MDVCVARQPILDRASKVYAYELLYRSNPGVNEFTGTDEDATTLDVIAGSLLTIGLQGIAGGKKAFINFGRNLLLDGLVSMLPKESVVIEVLESTEPDAEVVKCCRQLRELGYTIALDDFTWHPRFEQLVAVANIIKIDLRVTPRAEQERLVSLYRSRGIQMLAEKVETREEYEWAASIGYDYFQGYFFARPAIVTRKAIQPIVITCLQLLRELQSSEIDFKQLESLIRQDVGLTYKLFRYVNSVLLARHGNIQSIRSALVHLGEDGIRRWATLATLPRIANNKPEELVACAMIRARFSENLARLAGEPRFASAYLTGLFSLLDALLDRPLEEALQEVGLEPAINDVLLETHQAKETLSWIHALVRSYETGDWGQVSQASQSLGISDTDIGTAYVEATEWTNQILRGLHLSAERAPSAKGTSGKGTSGKGTSEKERRGSKREAISASITIMWGSHPQEECIAHAHLVDVSSRGARFRLATRVPPGAWLMFNHHKMSISGRGSVRYCRLIKGMYEVGVEFSGGTGWEEPSHSFGTHLRNLDVAIGRLQPKEVSAEKKSPANLSGATRR